MDFVEDAQSDTLKNTENFKFKRQRFSRVALVALPDGVIRTEDPYRSSERYSAQLALIPLRGDTTLPVAAKYIATLNLSGYELSAQDGENEQTYRLGYHIDGSPDPNWVEHAIVRRKHYQRGKVNEPELDASGNYKMTEERYREIYPPRLQYVVDSEASKMISIADRRETLLDGNVRLSFYDQDDWQRAIDIQAEVIARRREEIVAGGTK